jgi:uncharacterized membrane protein
MWRSNGPSRKAPLRSHDAPSVAAAGVPAWRLAAIGSGIVAYALLSHALMIHWPERAWAVAALFGPLWAAVAAGGWQRRHRPTLAACALVFAVVVVVVARGGVDDIHLMYVLQHAGIHATLAWAFASTLRPGGKALITAMAETLHRDFSPAIAAYTRKVTQVWSAYFFGMVVFSLALYTLAPWPWWSLYCNVLTPLAAAGLFFAEVAYRWHRHPEFERVALTDLVRAIRRRRADAR